MVQHFDLQQLAVLLNEHAPFSAARVYVEWSVVSHIEFG
jgi:hypothetical protein